MGAKKILSGTARGSQLTATWSKLISAYIFDFIFHFVFVVFMIAFCVFITPMMFKEFEVLQLVR